MILLDLVLGVLVGSMALTTAAILRWAVQARSRLPKAIVAFLLVTMAGMFAGSLVYYPAPGTRPAPRGSPDALGFERPRSLGRPAARSSGRVGAGTAKTGTRSGGVS